MPVQTETTVTVPESVVREAVAYLSAAADAIREAVGGPGADSTLLTERMELAAWKLEEHVVPDGQSDEERATDPRNVELHARADELCAEMLDALLPPRSRADAYRLNARQVREAGNTEIPFPAGGPTTLSDQELACRLGVLEDAVFGRRGHDA